MWQLCISYCCKSNNIMFLNNNKNNNENIHVSYSRYNNKNTVSFANRYNSVIFFTKCWSFVIVVGKTHLHRYIFFIYIFFFSQSIIGSLSPAVACYLSINCLLLYARQRVSMRANDIVIDIGAGKCCTTTPGSIKHLSHTKTTLN